MQASTASADLYYPAEMCNLYENRLQVVNMQPPEQLTAFNSNNVRAMLCWEPWGYNAAKGGDRRAHRPRLRVRNA